ncbi:uncharacterized protein LOC120078705 [Benincasa hispida]|uniref:uncharacterized protein LOC120078705 n=1 Tax=Benincasa hispida TaxID=102211 RepID=UPI0019006B79|nr:uncharacterized protein LOC120078705 [Benincasa hispida]
MSNLIIQLLAFDKFNGENYSNWKSNINTILVVDDLRFVLMEEHPPVPSSTATGNVRDVYDRWVRANEKARAYIMASISDVLNKKHEVIPTARKIMVSLQEMFGQPSSSVSHEANKYVYVTRMKDGTNVREHVVDIMVHFNIAVAHGAMIDETSHERVAVKEVIEQSKVRFWSVRYSEHAFGFAPYAYAYVYDALVYFGPMDRLTDH